MSRLITVLVAILIIGATAAPVSAHGFHPLRTARAAANLGLDTAHRGVDLGLDTAKGAVNVAKDAVTFDNCRPGAHYKGADGRWYECQ
jgi:hypothetical protein